MIAETTPVTETKEVVALKQMMDKIIAKDPSIKSFSFTKKQYADYFEQVKPWAVLLNSGNPQYKGREIKKIS